MADVTMPQLGETVTEGTITKWFKQVGDTVLADEPLFEVSTDKVDTEVPSPVAGVLQEIKAAEGDTILVGEVIAVVGDGAAAPTATPAAPAAEAPPAPAPAAEAPPVAPAPSPAAAPPVAPAAAPAPAVEAPTPVPHMASAADVELATSGDSRLLSPVVRRLVNEHGLDPSAITGTGAGGRITREDVLTHIESAGAQVVAPVVAPPSVAAAPVAAAPVGAPPVAVPATPALAPPRPVQAAPAARPGQRDEVVKLSKIRKLTGDHMVMSKSVTPHAFSVVEVDYANVDVARSALKAAWKSSEGFSLTYLPFICRAIVDALAEYPHLNASVGDGELIVHRFVDLGIAVDLDYNGLLVPVVRDADTKRLRAIAREINDLASRARSRKLSPDEISGGTFTISNNGSAGSVLTSAIINQPQVAIISTDAIKRRPVVVDLPGGGEGIAIHSVGNLAMSWDHRAFDGAYAANFLVKVKDVLEGRDWQAELS
jgi:pyruvate dehydrogenase E2 component (dihydrolipoamide acetyltransferase)